METMRYSNDYIQLRLQQFQEGELTQNQTAEMMEALRQRVAADRVAREAKEDSLNEMKDVKNEIEKLAVALGISVLSLRGFTVASAIDRIRQQVHEPFRSNQRLAELLCRLQDATYTQIGTGNILDDLEACIAKLENKVTSIGPTRNDFSATINPDGTIKTWSDANEV